MKKTTAILVSPNRFTALDAGRSASIVGAFLSGRSPRTFEAYRQDLQDFSRHVGAKTADEAARYLLAGGKGAANEAAHAYRAFLVDRGLAPATVNRRLAALRSLVQLARLFGLADFTLDVPSVKSQPYRDTRGPGLDGVRRILGELARRTDRKGRRDHAIVRLLFDIGLRRGEVVALDLADVDFEAGTVAVVGKGRTEPETITLPEPTKAALASWVAVRGGGAGPLFLNCDRAGKGGRLTGRSVARVLGAIGKKVGLVVRPHGLRHAAITEALDATGGDVRSVQKFSRHRDLRVLTRYDDNRQDLAGEVARLVAGRV